MNTPRNRTQRLGLIVAGAIILLGQGFDLTFGRYGWPLFVVVPSLLCFAVAALGGTATAALFVPASVITTVGFILFAQHLSGRFESWAYAWALIPVAVGVGLSVQGWRIEDASLRRQGRRLVGTFVLFFLAFTFFFEGFIFNNPADTWVSRFVPLLFIAAGAFLLWRRGGDEGRP